MNITFSQSRNIYQQKHKKNGNTHSYPSFKGPADTIITSVRDKAIMNVFSQHYGNIGERIGEKLYKLTTESTVLEKSSRFSMKDGTLSIKDKNIVRSIGENIIFPFITLPLYGASAILKNLQGIPAISNKAKSLYNKTLFRFPRKMNELDSKTDIMKGILEQTEKVLGNFAKEKGLVKDINNKEEVKKAVTDLANMLNNPSKHPESKGLIDEANEYVKENLYKVSNKFFDKHTGNFNTAYERPLNRIISGVIPVAFLANDAYNLSVLCGDKKEDSEKEADARTKQEIIRVFTTAYIQLLMFGAFTKQVNNIPWFAPVASAATTLVSEIFSRKKLDRPVFFLSKETAVEYNQNQKQNKNDILIAKNNTTQQPKIIDTTKSMDLEKETGVFKGFNSVSNGKGITSFSANNKENKKEEPKKALMNFDTFKKGVVVLTGSFLALNFLKNSSYTKNSFIVQGAKDIAKWLKNNVYKPLAYKDFEITPQKFQEIMESLKKAGCEKVAEGHEFIENKYAQSTENGTIKIFKSKLGDKEVDKVIKSVSDEMQNINSSISDKDKDVISNAIKTAIRLKKANIEENKFTNVAQQAIEIIKNKNVNLNDTQLQAVKQTIEEAIKISSKQEAIQIATKIKPFVDILTEPFKFVFSAARLPFKFLKAGVNIVAGKVEKKAGEEILGKAEFKTWERNVHKVITEIFGEKEAKSGKISQTVFANAMEQLEKKTLPYRKAEQALNEAINAGKSKEEIAKLTQKVEETKKKLLVYVNTAVEKSFNGITQSSNKNTDLALMSKLASSTVTSAFLVADNYNMVMIKSNGDDTEEAKEKANERIIQRLSGLFYQALFINWFNATFRSTYNSSLTGMTSVVIPNTLTTEILMRKSIGMPVGRMTIDELNEMDRENENRTGIVGKYFEFMRLLTGKKPLKDRLPKEKQETNQDKDTTTSNKHVFSIPQNNNTNKIQHTSTNVLELLSKK